MIPAAGRALTPAQYRVTPPPFSSWPFNALALDRYLVNRVYPTVQGEGRMAGTPMTILRLQGCPVGCVFCDTPESWGTVGRPWGGDPEVGVPEPGGRGFAGADALADEVAALPPRWVLVTGGEPCWHDLGALTDALRERGLWTALETSGVFPITGVWSWVTVSPKPDGRLPLLARSLDHANEVKWVVGREQDLRRLEAFLVEHHLRMRGRVAVQPMSGSVRATQLCLDALMQHPQWRLSIQVHKLLGIA